MKIFRYILFFFSLMVVSVTPVNARVVTFTRVTVETGLSVPHGDWTGNIDGTSGAYELDILATVAMAGNAVWYSNTGKGKTWSAEHLIWTAPHYDYEVASTDLDNNGTVDAVSTDDDPSTTTNTPSDTFGAVLLSEG